MKLLVTGRAGFIGSAVVRLAVQRGHQVVNLDALTYAANLGNDFVKTMLRLSDTRDEISVVDGQISGPTPDASWCTSARAIFNAAGRPTRVIGIPSSAYPTPTARALNSRIDCVSISQTVGIRRPDWQLELRKSLKELAQPA
jgi:dTDP-4-dehydrorhamnose reductase